ncbi:hypothetical protein HDV57DRAFT_499712 [Trichoderma longibrachiatum]
MYLASRRSWSMPAFVVAFLLFDINHARGQCIRYRQNLHPGQTCMRRTKRQVMTGWNTIQNRTNQTRPEPESGRGCPATPQKIRPYQVQRTTCPRCHQALLGDAHRGLRPTRIHSAKAV